MRALSANSRANASASLCRMALTIWSTTSLLPADRLDQAVHYRHLLSSLLCLLLAEMLHVRMLSPPFPVSEASRWRIAVTKRFTTPKRGQSRPVAPIAAGLAPALRTRTMLAARIQTRKLKNPK